MNITTLKVSAPPRFNFWDTVRSHGWCVLPPFSYDVEQRVLKRVYAPGGNRPVVCTLRAGKNCVAIRVGSTHVLDADDRASIRAMVRTCLRLDEDFTSFHAAARQLPRYRWIAQAGAGRMLRSPTVFEDVVKMICTTNCTWAFTTIIVRNLVEALGSKSGDSVDFPTAEALASTTETFLRREVKAGYRAPFLLELAEKIAARRIDAESWRNSARTPDELFEEMRSLKGIGPYAAGNLMKLVGRYDHLGLDSWVRSQFYKRYTRGRKVADSRIEKQYATLGMWRGLFFWLDMTRSLHDNKFKF